MSKAFRNSAILVAAALLLAGLPARGDDSAPELWVISTRSAPRSCVGKDAAARFRYLRRGGDNRWETSSAEALLASPETLTPTTVFVHGNRVDSNEAVADGMRLYRILRRQARGQPFRLVIWSWPSNRVCRGRRSDVRIKAAYSDVQGYYLADFLRRVDSEVPVGLVGYSFGARIVTAALHLIDGDRLGGPALPKLDIGASTTEDSVAENSDSMAPARGAPPRRRAVLIAAALDAHWLAPGQRHGRALTQVERLLVLRNSCDPVLRFYPLMYCVGGPQALGYVGPVCGRADREKVEVLDVRCAVGRAHGWARYVAAAGLQRRLGKFTFLESHEAAAELVVPELPAAAR